MHRAKGLEFRAVVVMACDGRGDSVGNSARRSGDDADLEEL